MKAIAKHRTHSIEFKRQIAQDFIAGETLHALASRHDVSRNLIRICVRKFEAGAFDDDAQAADLLQDYERKIAALERMVGRQALEIEFLKRGYEKRTAAEKREYIRHHRPRGLSIAEGCLLMGLSSSTDYDVPALPIDDAALVATMIAICDEFEAYRYRRVGAELRHRGIVVYSKKIVVSCR